MGVVVLAEDVEDVWPLIDDVFEVEGVDARDVFEAPPKPLVVVEPEKEDRVWSFGVTERGAGPEESGDLSLRGLTPASAREDFRCIDLVGVAIPLVLLLGGLLVDDGVGVVTVKLLVLLLVESPDDGFLLAGGEGEEEPSELLPLPPRREDPLVGRSPL